MFAATLLLLKDIIIQKGSSMNGTGAGVLYEDAAAGVSADVEKLSCIHVASSVITTCLSQDGSSVVVVNSGSRLFYSPCPPEVVE